MRVLDRLMTTDETADFLNVSYSWLKKAAQRGEVPCTRIGRAVRFSQSHVEAIVAAVRHVLWDCDSMAPRAASSSRFVAWSHLEPPA